MDNMNMPTSAKPKTGVVVTAVLASAVIFGGLGYYIGQMYETAPAGTVTYTSPTASTAVSTSPASSASSDATASWKTYTNTKYGYSFKYPPTNQAPAAELMDSGEATTESNTVLLYLTDGEEQTEELTAIRISADPLANIYKDLSLSAFIEKISRQAYTVSDLKVGNKSGVKVNYTTGAYNILNDAGQVANGNSGSDVRFYKNSDTVFIVEPNTNGTKTGNPALADQILATLTFTK